MKHKVTRLLFITLLVVAHTTAFIQPASAEVIQNTRETMDFTLYNECEDEWVQGTIEVHLIWIFNSGRVDSIHTNVHGTAVGLTTGNSYIAKNNYKDDFTNFGCGGTATARANVRLISKGKAPNRDADFLITYALDANCNPLPTEISVDLRCKG